MDVTIDVSLREGRRLQVTMTVGYGTKRTQVRFDVEAPQVDPEGLNTAILEEARLVLAALREVEPEKLPLPKPARYFP